MIRSTRIADMLGGASVLKRDIRGDLDLESLVRGGVPAESVRCLARYTGSTLTKIQDLTRIDRSTFARRARADAKLKPSESDRLVRVARIASLAIDALGREDGLAWLQEPNDALGERIPIEVIDTEVGARQVEQVIGRIEHGVYS
ncbi:MAG: type II RES/Xre toxin-antitoxin system antitoxin [Vulcanimicrobiaceae bacterium]